MVGVILSAIIGWELLLVLCLIGVPAVVIVGLIRLTNRSRSGRAPTATGPAAAWLSDPTRRHQVRYWDGQRWTEHVADSGRQARDPIE